MKRLMIGATVIALLTAPVAIARPDNHGNGRGEDGQQAGWQHDGRQQDARHSDNESHSDNGRHNGWGRDRGYNARWSRGQQMGYNDWHNSRQVDYRRYHLRQPPRGYEWRRNDDRFILVAVTTGLIMSVILSNGR